MKIKAFSGVVPLCFLPLVVSQSTSVQSAPPSSSSSPASSSSQPSSSPSNSPSNGDGGGGASESATGSTGSAKGLSLTYASDIVVPATPPVRSVSFESHGPFTGSASVTGALTASKVLGTALSGQPAPTNATSYPSDGELHGAQPAPYFPAGGLGTNGTAPVYNVRSDYDYQSIALALHLEWMIYDLFQTGASQFKPKDFQALGLIQSDYDSISLMANQSQGHVTLLSNIIGESAPGPCTHNFPFKTAYEFLDFSQKLTAVTESTVYNFLPHLDSHGTAMLVLQLVATTARQHMLFRQFEALQPMPVWFETGIPQSWGWTLVAPFISSCPDDARVVWRNFPALQIIDGPNAARKGGSGKNETVGGGLGVVNSTAIPSDKPCLGSSSSNNTSSGRTGKAPRGRYDRQYEHVAAANTTGSGGSANSTSSGGPKPSGTGGSGSSSGGGLSTECKPGITSNRTKPLSEPGRKILLQWESAGRPVGPNNSYITNTQAKEPAFVAWITQLNITYTPLEVMDNGNNGDNGGGSGGGNTTSSSSALEPSVVAVVEEVLQMEPALFTGTTMQPDFATFAGDPAVNGTVFIAITDEDLFLTPFNLSLIDSHVVAGPAIYQAG
ncbi:rds1 [Trichophyton equinum CBS 127.97]|uniref:Rds1 n=1 Tax=Trichophyton equinum (strain ATCC MYA-4606 / CBS 127.97) TaxID=559882 RepID=F2Q3S9_TRIEC|nr:rds1 [Trichophyton equinum CBS 127.97]